MDVNRSPVLLAQSDASLRAEAADDLSAAGFNVIEVTSTDEALSYLESRSDVRVVITEIEMPGCLSGLELARFVHRRWPEIDVILVGWPRLPTPSFPQLVSFLPVPCPASALVEQVRICLLRHRSEGMRKG